MNQELRNHADQIVREVIAAVQPDAAVKRALEGMDFPGRVLLVAAGKAAWQMAKAADDCLGSRIESGVVVTKYNHVMGPIARFTCFEAGHPVPDENSFRGTQAALDLVSGLTEKDTVLFLLSGGGSALFEKPLVPAEELQDITGQLLACGADIVEINTIRKRLSAVKGGRFARLCRPARVEAVVLSDILGDPLDMIASGPACPDTATAEDARRIQKKYSLRMSEAALKLLDTETPKSLDNVHTQINGSVRELCRAAAGACRRLGYEPVLLTDQLCCQAREAGSFLASILRTHAHEGKSLAFIAGGETVVKLTGHGLGGRNQEIALAAASGISGIFNAAVFSVGSDGTDGPTDAAGGYSDGATCRELAESGLSVDAVLQDNDAYHALKKTGGLIMTGPTGTNVNDVAVALLKSETAF
ncbi:MAG: glycerate kinase [Clostridia bacterium]|nr:glycerate kinase [Clostridia bacterium]MBQ6721680.1 glycerate kinase [Clostridia bacterium]